VIQHLDLLYSSAAIDTYGNIGRTALGFIVGIAEGQRRRLMNFLRNIVKNKNSYPSPYIVIIVAWRGALAVTSRGWSPIRVHSS